jgi:hypothetical protein
MRRSQAVIILAYFWSNHRPGHPLYLAKCLFGVEKVYQGIGRFQPAPYAILHITLFAEHLEEGDRYGFAQCQSTHE